MREGEIARLENNINVRVWTFRLAFIVLQQNSRFVTIKMIALR